MSAVHIIWKCTKPNSQTLVKFYEQLMTQAAHSKGMDTAISKSAEKFSVFSGPARMYMVFEAL
jgi:hypothetical protein